MKEYLLVFRGGDMRQVNETSENMAKHMEVWKKWMGELAQNGNFTGGQPLTQDGRVMTERGAKITDGPYAEGKEVINGYLLIKATDYNHAVELSKGCPVFEIGGIIEVREIAQIDM